MTSTAPPEAPPKTLAGIIADVYLTLGRIPKTGRHPTQGWSFATDADIADAVRGALGLRGVVITAELLEHHQETIGTTKGGASVYRHTVRMRFTLTDGTDAWPLLWTGQADDATDKGLPKAITFARKTFLLSTFLMSTGDSADEPDAHDAGIAAPPVSSKRRSRWAALCAMGLPEDEVTAVLRGLGMESSEGLEDDQNYAWAESAVAAAAKVFAPEGAS